MSLKSRINPIIDSHGRGIEERTEEVHLRSARDSEITQSRGRIIKAGLAAGVALASVGLLANRIDSTSANADTLEAPDDNGSYEQEGILSSVIKPGKLTLNEGVNIRHTPAIDKPDGSTGDFGNNLAYTLQPGEILSVE